jgi:3-isopropylmalate dehydrogenase
MMFRHTFANGQVADRIEGAVRTALRRGLRTPDIASPADTVIGTRAMGDAVIAALRAD